ncbi:partner and localizer of BRCA2 [Phyllobates terribilis]|uniref:partner and localizer of BRCA2 n=1 Tax=Phyllobates terribilis TaxID=111132 RepID=UPI003CCABA25
MAATCQEMENMPERSLTLEEKTKLKERLALLKKEYKKTFHRLQRSQRAERVKTHIKKTIEEQNRLLSQELSTKQESVSVLPGPHTNVSNVTGKVTQSINPPSAEKERKPIVSFNLDPEILQGDKRSSSCSGSKNSGEDKRSSSCSGSESSSQDKRSSSCSGSKNSGQDKRSSSCSGNESSSQEPSTASKAEAGGLSDPNHGTRSRLRLNRSARRVCSESTATNSPEGRYSHKEAKSTRGSALCLNEVGPLKINESTFNSMSRRVQVSHECKNDLGVNGFAQQRIYMEDTIAPASPVFKKCLTEGFPTNIKLFSQNIEHLYPEEKEALDTGQEETTNHSPESSRSKTMQTGKEPAPSDADKTQQMVGGTCPDSILDATCDLSAIPRVVETSSTSPPCADNQHGESPSVEEKRSPLDSCTLVEGLLFPVEYYVRTTRRMTSCQRKVDLEAVINSQLGGTARTGTRSRARRASTSLTASLQVTGTPTSSRRGRKSCLATVASGSNHISKQLEFSSDKNPKGDGNEGVKETSLEGEMSREMCAENPKMEEGVKKAKADGREVSITQYGDGYGLHDEAPRTEGLQRRVYNLRTTAKTRETGSPFRLFGSRPNLLLLLRHSDITDFHLPDEDFGLLKLKKLKSINLLERFVTDPSKQQKYYKRADSIDNPTVPDCDNPTLLHGPAGVCPSASPKLAELGKANDNSFLDSSQTTLRDKVSAAQRGRTASQTSISKEEPEGVQCSLSKETNGTVTHGSPVTRSLQQVFYDAPQHTAVWKPTYSSAQVSEPVLQAPYESLDLEASTSVQDVVVLGTNMEPAVDMNSCLETKPPLSVLGSAKEDTCNIVLSTSMCSVPADPHTESVFSGCTPGLPMLGFTPAAFSSLAPCEQTSPRTISFPPFNNVDELVAKDNDAAHQFRNLSLPPPGGDTQESAVKKTHLQEYEESANRLDQCDEEGMMGGDHLLLISEIKDACDGGPPVDLCSLWWDFPGRIDLCIVSASEYSVRLWRPQEVCKWKCVHNWNFPEIPVIQILPLFQEKNLVCVALGNVEIMEIWALTSNPELLTWEKQLVKHGLIKTSQGLSRHRLVTTSGEGGSQVVELWQLAENGSVAGSHTLVAPKDSVVAFSEVDGERDALVGSTVDNNLVLWNSVSGHLLGTFYIGNICSDLTCISATSDSGLLFFVVGSSLNKPCEINGSCGFKLLATNPHGGASALIMAYTLPDRISSRFLEGDVKKQTAAAVLSCGSIALWDLSNSHCSAVLPPDCDTPWCLVRWGRGSSWLLAGRKDGSICVYEHTDCG